MKEKVFYLENEIEYSSIIDSLRSLFIQINPFEVFFSIEFQFLEKGKEKELYDDFISGINNMKEFLQAMKVDINEECELSDQLQSKIDALNFYRVPKNFLFIDDYVYYIKEDSFEKAYRAEFQLTDKRNSNIRIPLSAFYKSYPNFVEGQTDLFNSFTLMHVFLFERQKKLMPTFMIVYEDDLYEFRSFESSIKTTLYRKITEINSKIETDKIKAILFVSEMLNYSTDENLEKVINTDSKSRLQYKTSESLGCYYIDNELEFKQLHFSSDKIGDPEYIASIFAKEPEQSLLSFFQPFINTFKRLNN